MQGEDTQPADADRLAGRAARRVVPRGRPCDHHRPRRRASSRTTASATCCTPMPFNDSNPILYYNKNVVPERRARSRTSRRRTFDEVKADAQQIVRQSAPRSSVSRSRPTRGRSSTGSPRRGTRSSTTATAARARATKVTFDDATGVSIFAVARRHGEVEARAEHRHERAQPLPRGRATAQAAMTIDTSAALGTISQLFAAGQYKNVRLGVGPMPGPDSPDGGVLVGGAANYIVEQVGAREAGRGVRVREVPRRSRRSSRHGRPRPATCPCRSRRRRCRRCRSSTRSSPSTRSRTTSCSRDRRTRRPPGRCIGAYGVEGRGRAGRDHRRDLAHARRAS